MKSRTAMKKKINAAFYYFSKAASSPKSVPIKLQWEEVYNNFQLLQSRKNTTNINKRKILQDTENSNQAVLMLNSNS